MHVMTLMLSLTLFYLSEDEAPSADQQQAEGESQDSV